MVDLELPHGTVEENHPFFRSVAQGCRPEYIDQFHEGDVDSKDGVLSSVVQIVEKLIGMIFF